MKRIVWDYFSYIYLNNLLSFHCFYIFLFFYNSILFSLLSLLITNDIPSSYFRMNLLSLFISCLNSYLIYPPSLLFSSRYIQSRLPFSIIKIESASPYLTLCKADLFRIQNMRNLFIFENVVLIKDKRFDFFIKDKLKC